MAHGPAASLRNLLGKQTPGPIPGLLNRKLRMGAPLRSPPGDSGACSSLRTGWPELEREEDAFLNMEGCFLNVVSSLLQRAQPGGQSALLGMATLRFSVSCLVLQMMQFAWHSYRRYAMGKNELRPLTKDGYEGNMFGEWPSGRPTAPWRLSGILMLTVHLQSCVPVSAEPGLPSLLSFLGCSDF